MSKTIFNVAILVVILGGAIWFLTRGAGNSNEIVLTDSEMNSAMQASQDAYSTSTTNSGNGAMMQAGTTGSAGTAITNNKKIMNATFNTNKGNFTIQFESESGVGVKVLTHDILGRKVYDQSFDAVSNFNQNIQLSNVSAGIYFVTVIDGNRRTVKKIIIN